MDGGRFLSWLSDGYRRSESELGTPGDGTARGRKQLQHITSQEAACRPLKYAA
jgi:hypothetical protein